MLRSLVGSEMCIRDSGIRADDLIGISLVRSEWMVISILGILKSGGAYVPIDPEYPQERIDYMIKDSGCRVVIDEAELEVFRSEHQRYSKDNLNQRAQPQHLAYVIYTSGSTGNPKGVMIEHRNIYAFIRWSQTEFRHSSFDIVLAVTSICFDLSCFEIFYPLSIGKPIQVLSNALSVVHCLNTRQKVLLNTVPSVVGALLYLSLIHISEPTRLLS